MVIKWFFSSFSDSEYTISNVAVFQTVDDNIIKLWSKGLFTIFHPSNILEVAFSEWEIRRLIGPF